MNQDSQLKHPRTRNRAQRVTRKLSPRTREVLADLSARHLNGFVSPMMVGGFDGSHHSATLALLVRHGLAERRPRGTLMNTIRQMSGGKNAASWEYRITDAGRAKLREKP